MAAVLLLLMAFAPGHALARQTGQVSGVITDAESGDSLPGANVFIQGTTIGATSDIDGRYQLTVPEGNHVLQVSFVGFKPTHANITITAGSTLKRDFALQEDLVGAGEIVVLGTRRQGRTITDSPVPVDVISPAEIEATGMSETTQILQMLIPSYNAPQASVTDGSDHVRPATLRGLGPDQTLILVNGKRRHTSSLVHVNGSVGRGSTGVDLNAIPAGAIERVEVLRDGAAAQYGSDAIAGVINIVLKERRGLDASLTLGQYVSSVIRGYEESEGNVAGEGPDTYNWDGDGVNIGSPEKVSYSDGQTLNLNLGYGFGLGKGDFYVSGALRHRDYVNRAGLDPRTQYASGFNGGSYSETTFPRENHRIGNGSFDDISLFFNGSMPVGGSGAKFYTFGGASTRDGLSGCYYRRSLDSRTNTSIYPDGFLPKINGRIQDYSAAGGLKGSKAGWAYDVSETLGYNTFNFHISDSHNASMNDGQTEFDAGSLNFMQSNTNLDLFRSVNIGTAAPMSIAIGGEFRYENYSIDPGEPNSYKNGGNGRAAGSQCFPGFEPASSQDEGRTNVGFYLDVENNLTSRLLVSAAGRFESYSDFGSTATGKLATRFELSPELAVRGAVSTGFRAPSLAQAWFTSIATNFIGGVPFEVGTFPVAGEVAQALGAEPLDPEKSTNLSAGVTYAKGNLTVTVDAYRLDIKDRITFTENFVKAATGDYLKSQGINAAGGRFFTNAVDTRTNGLDVIARYGQRLGKGTARVTLAANFNETEVTNKDANGEIASTAFLSSLGEGALVGRVRIGDFEVAQPRNKVNAQFNYDLDAWRFMFRMNRYGEVSNLQTVADRDQVFSAKILSDAEIAYEVKGGINVALGANNLFDVYPDKQYKANSFNGIFAYSGFSPFGFFGRYVYTRISVKL